MSRPSIPTQVAKLLPMLASDQDGEVVAAARAICRTLATAKLDLHDVVKALTLAPNPRSKKGKRSWQAPSAAANPDADLASWCSRRASDWLPEKDLAFLSGIEVRLTRWGGRLTSAQREWLNDIRSRIEAREAA